MAIVPTGSANPQIRPSVLEQYVNSLGSMAQAYAGLQHAQAMQRQSTTQQQQVWDAAMQRALSLPTDEGIAVLQSAGAPQHQIDYYNSMKGQRPYDWHQHDTQKVRAEGGAGYNLNAQGQINPWTPPSSTIPPPGQASKTTGAASTPFQQVLQNPPSPSPLSLTPPPPVNFAPPYAGPDQGRLDSNTMGFAANLMGQTMYGGGFSG